MDRRRANAKPEEVVWSKAVQSLNTLEAAHLDANDKINRVNDLINALPGGVLVDQDSFGENVEATKISYKKLHTGLAAIRSTAQDELKAIAEALENVSLLIALKRAPETPVATEIKRTKRARLSSPASSTRTPRSTPPPHTLTLSLPARPAVNNNTQGFSREPKARREALAGQLPLQPGRKVAFRPPPNKGPGDGKKVEEEENSWILAVVKRCINQDKNRYEVQDVDEDGQPGPSYNTTLRALIPLPDPNAPLGSITHPSSYDEFTKGSIVMAQYPDTTTFYKAEVVQTPRESTAASGKAGVAKSVPIYRLKFEDDDGQVRVVAAHLVVEWPGEG